MKQALLVVSCGTSALTGRTDIALVEKALASEAPGRDFFRAFTSPEIREELARQGEWVPSAAEALDELEHRGYRDLLIQPAQLFCGSEYGSLAEQAERLAARFDRLIVGRPLLSDHGNLLALAEALFRRHGGDKRCASVFFGHGSPTLDGMVYPALQTALRLIGCEDGFVGTQAGWPGYEEVLRQLIAGGYQAVKLVPVLLAAGGPVFQEMAGDGPGSWKTRLKEAGFSVCAATQGLGTLPEVQQIFRTQLRRMMMQEGIRE